MRGSFSSTLLVLAVGASCAGEPADKRDVEFNVALLAAGPIADQAWNGGATPSLLAILDTFSASISWIQMRGTNTQERLESVPVVVTEGERQSPVLWTSSRR